MAKIAGCYRRASLAALHDAARPQFSVTIATKITGGLVGQSGKNESFLLARVIIAAALFDMVKIKAVGPNLDYFGGSTAIIFSLFRLRREGIAMSDEQSPLDGYIAAVDERIRRLEKLAPAEEERPSNRPEPQPDLNCPLCGQKMQRGLVSVHGTFLGFMTVGFSHQQCWFQAWGSDAEEEIIPSGHAKKGWRCHDCGFVGIGIGEARPARKSIGDL